MYSVIPKLDASLAETLKLTEDQYNRNVEWYNSSWAHRFLVTKPILDLVAVRQDHEYYRAQLNEFAVSLLHGHQSYVSFSENEVWKYRLNQVPTVAIGE
jgi:hypothetical protein